MEFFWKASLVDVRTQHQFTRKRPMVFTCARDMDEWVIAEMQDSVRFEFPLPCCLHRARRECRLSPPNTYEWSDQVSLSDRGSYLVVSVGGGPVVLALVLRAEGVEARDGLRRRPLQRQETGPCGT
jgi:hypothetical protein